MGSQFLCEGTSKCGHKCILQIVTDHLLRRKSPAFRNMVMDVLYLGVWSLSCGVGDPVWHFEWQCEIAHLYLIYLITGILELIYSGAEIKHTETWTKARLLNTENRGCIKETFKDDNCQVFVSGWIWSLQKKPETSNEFKDEILKCKELCIHSVAWNSESKREPLKNYK